MDVKKLKIPELLKISLNEIKELSKNDQIFVLEKLVKYHNEQYFLENNPQISDEDFDVFSEELKKLNPSSSVLYEIVGEIGSVTHPYPMLSIEKVFSFEDVLHWLENVKDENYLVEPKYDGMRAMYRKTDKVLATRGNGRVGEDISERFKYLNIIGDLEKAGDIVEGEIVIPHEYFIKNLSQTYKNSRNAVVGIIKSKIITPEGIKALNEDGVHFVLYDQVYATKVTLADLSTKENFEEILENTFHSQYPLDGVVIKATNNDLKKSLGSTAHHEKWQVAYKVPGERKWSEVIGITDQVGRTGRITAVAHINPIELSGATVQNVTLHNFDYIEKSKIGIGAKVEVIRSGEVIPFITNVLSAKDYHKAPSKCPECGGKTAFSGKYLECINPKCPAKVWQEIEYFFKALDVEELGEKRVRKFIEEFQLTNVIDFYNLKKEQISSLPGFKDKSAEKITGNVKATLHQKITESELLNALGIKEVGRTTANLILSEYGFDNLPKLTAEDLMKIKGIGPSIAESFVKQVRDRWWVVTELKKLGLKFKSSKSSNKLNGKSFCVTGKKEQFSRDELIKMISENGGTYKSTVTKDLDYLIAGEDAGSKLDKANEYGVRVINEVDFLKMLE